MLAILARCEPARISSVLCILVLVMPVAGTTEAGHRTGHPAWPVTSPDMLRKQPEGDRPEQQTRQASRGENRQPTRHAASLPGRRASGLAKAPGCLPERLKATLRSIEERWGPVRIISAHRPGARIRKTGRPSLHASCRAVDFRPPKGSYRAVAGWLKKSHAGGVGTYSGKHNHIHIDARPCKLAKCYRWHN